MHAQSEPNMIYALKTRKRYFCRPILARCVAVVSPSMRNACAYQAHSPREALLHLTSERRPTVPWLKSESAASASHLLPLMPPKVKKAAHRAAKGTTTGVDRLVTATTVASAVAAAASAGARGHRHAAKRAWRAVGLARRSPHQSRGRDRHSDHRN